MLMIEKEKQFFEVIKAFIVFLIKNKKGTC